MENNNQRKIAILTDCHALLEPTKAIFEDINRRGIMEIYSLGDNIGMGPNPGEVIDLLEENSVISVAGNAEEYVRLGIEPFYSYFNTLKTKSCLWTLSKLNERQKGVISLYPHYIELLVGGKKVALCHFANDVRVDIRHYCSKDYYSKITSGMPGYHQFFNTNSEQQRQYINKNLMRYGEHNPTMKGYIDALEHPLFGGKIVDFYDAIIQGHVHWKVYESSDSTDFYSIRAVGIAYDKDPIDTASYVILNEKEDGFDLEEVLVRFDRERMEYSILTSDSPDTLVYKYAEVGKHL